MVYYDRECEYSPMNVFLHLHQYIEKYVSEDILFMYFWFDMFFYALFGILGYTAFGIGFWWMFVFFAFVFIVEHCLAYVYFYIVPKARANSKDIHRIELYIQKLEDKQYRWDNKGGDSMWDYNTRYNVIDYLREWIKEERAYIDTLQKAPVKETVEDVESDVWDASEKIKVGKLMSYRNKISEYVTTHHMKFLSNTESALVSLIDIVHQKPIGIRLVSNNLFVYFDELFYILDKYKGFSDKNVSKYNTTIQQISNKLSENIRKIVYRIEKFETDDIEVSMNVLLKELDNFQNMDVSDIEIQLKNAEKDISTIKEERK